MHTFALLLASGIPLISAYPTASAPRASFPEWKAPGPNDARSPCPGINTMANHGILPRNGKNITTAMVVDAAKSTFNFAADFPAGAALLGESVHHPLDGEWDLDDVSMHNFPIEQDASLSRVDAYFGNPAAFNQAVFDSTLSQFAGSNYTSYATIGKAHYARVVDSRKNNPQFLYGARQYVSSYLRDAVGISAMSDPYSGAARVDWYSYFIQNERLPTELGWTTPKQEANIATYAMLAAKIAATVPQDVAPVAITEDTVKDILQLINPVTGIVATAINPGGT